MFDKSLVGRNSLGRWIGALHLLGDPWEMSELPVLSWDPPPAAQCWDRPVGAWVALKAPSDFFKEYIFFELLLFNFRCVCVCVCVGSVMGSHFTSKVVPVVGVNDSLTLNGFF